MLNKKHISTLAASAMCLVIAGVSHAQNRTIEEVTVTAAKKEQTLQERDDVLNGIAYDKDNNRLFVTGKHWSKLFEIELVKK